MNFWNNPLWPEAASKDAAAHDKLFFTITGLSVFFTVLVCVLVTVLAVKYRRGTKADRTNPIDHSTKLEVLWTGVPLILALGTFVWSARLFVENRDMDRDAMDVFVVGKQWMWHLQHMDGTRENNELHLPVGQPVKMTMISQDVIHAMYLPAFRAQYHVVPGRYTELQFTPTKPGSYRMLCAMHCGTHHSEMVGWVHVMEADEFAEWKEANGDKNRPKAGSVIEAGKMVFEDKNCGSCHTGENNVKGPSLYGIMGEQRSLANGQTVAVDNDYLRLSIIDPTSQIVEGYDKTMPSYSSLTEEDILALNAYVKSLGNAGDLVPFERPGAPVPPTATAPDSSTDTANRTASPSTTQTEDEIQ
jgi:cytochrome c oxidase subunit 2